MTCPNKFCEAEQTMTTTMTGHSPLRFRTRRLSSKVEITRAVKLRLQTRKDTVSVKDEMSLSMEKN